MQALLVAAAALSQAGPDSWVEVVSPVAVAGTSRVPTFQTRTLYPGNGEPVFPDLTDEGKLYDWPEYFINRPAAGSFTESTNGLIPAGAEVKFHCGFRGPCDAVVFIYDCYPCKGQPGGLPQKLLQDGFTRTRCAPTFTVRKGGARLRMSSFHKVVARAETFIFTMPGDVKYALFGVSNGDASDCPALDEVGCINTNGFCTFAGGECKYTTCVSQGPGGPCDERFCVEEELKKIA